MRNQLSFLTVATVFLLLLTYPFLGMIWHHEYPLFSLEAGAFLLLAVAGALILAGLTMLLRTWIAYALVTICLLLSFLLQFNLPFTGLLTLLLVFGLLVALLREKTPVFLVPVLLALQLGSYLDARLERAGSISSADMTPGRQDLPLVIHLVMDSLSGPDGLPRDTLGEQTRAAMLGLFADGGFTMFPKAFSRYSATVDSLYYAFNFQEGNLSPYSYNSIAHQAHQFNENRHFDRLAAGGYRIRVFQNEEMNFCRPTDPSADPCWSYTLPNLDSVRLGVGDVWTRTRLLVNTMLRRSRLVGKYQPDTFGIAVFEPRIFPQLLADIERRPRGVAYFAHVLFPHNPFAYRSDCSIDYEQPPWARFSRLKNELNVPDHVYQRRYFLYQRQAHCALQMLGYFFSDLREKGLYDDAIIIVHGDHGSMVSRRPPRANMVEYLERDDYLDTFSTLFAIKLPGGKASQVEEVLALEQLMELAAQSIEHGEAGASEIFEGLGETGESGQARDTHVYLLGSIPLRRVDIDLFEPKDDL